MNPDLTVKCRGCLADDPEMHNIFDLLTGDVTLASILSETTSTQIEESKEISCYLCVKCTRIVVDFYNFKDQFFKSQAYFQNELKNLMDNNTLEALNEVPSENIILVEESGILEEISYISKELLEHTDNTTDSSENLPPLKSIAINDNNEQIMLNNLITEINNEVKPEVGEFTVQNELVQLIESVVFCCKNCNKKYLLKDEFLNHMNSEHGKTKVDASKFTKKTLVKLPLAKIEVDNSDLNFELDMKEEDEIQCKFCNIMVLKTEYESHHEEHKTHICSCGAKFLRKSHLINHEMSVHSNERRFVCQYCNKAFKTKQSLAKHLRYHTHPRSEICHICGQIFNDKSVLNTHIKLKHFPSRDFQCSYCGLNFPLKSTLFKHTRRHHSTDRKRTFSCSICNMTYFEKSTLNRHMSVKHSEHPVKAKCEYCGKVFTTKGNLYKHLRTTHKYDRVVITSDGTIMVQKSA